jgi:acyl-CoA reductase-like NAD-dependent aldehyde dehydrogenase
MTDHVWRLLTNMPDSLLEEEIFGPILPVIKADYKEAIRITNE